LEPKKKGNNSSKTRKNTAESGKRGKGYRKRKESWKKKKTDGYPWDVKGPGELLLPNGNDSNEMALTKREDCLQEVVKQKSCSSR